MDANGCTYPRIYFTITQPSSSIITGQVTDVDCFGNSTGAIDVTYTSSPTVTQNTFNWVGTNFSSTSIDIINLQAGLYTLTVIENNLCTVTSSYFVPEPQEILVGEVIHPVGCYFSASLTISGGTPAYYVDWFGANTQALTAGIYNYSVIDQNGCSFSDSILVQQQSLSGNYTTTNISCNGGDDGTVTITGIGGTTPYTISLLNANPSQLSAGYYTYMIVDSSSCIYTDSFLITEPSSISVTSNTTNVSCNGGNDGTATLTFSGGTGTLTADWGGLNPLVLSAGTYIYTIIDGNMCDTSGTVTILEPPSISVSTVINPTTCHDSFYGNVTVNVSGGTPGYSYLWSTIPIQTTPTVTGLAVGTYICTITDTKGCTESNQVLIPSLSNISVTDTVIHPKCFGFCDGSADLNISNGVLPYIINWYGYSPDSLCDGIYFYKVTDSLGCEYENSVLIIHPQLITHNIIYQNNILEDVVTGGTPPYTWYWWNSTTSLGGGSSIIPITNGNHYCVVIDNNLCHTDTIFYFIDDIISNTDFLEGVEFNIFPNPSDGNFTITFVAGKNLIKGYKIYNLLGEIIISEEIEEFLGSYSKSINLQTKAKGIYLLEIKQMKE